MIITKKMMHPSLRFRGSLIRFLIPKYTMNKVKFFNHYVNKVSKKFLVSHKIKKEDKFITRSDGSKLRVCVYSKGNLSPNATGLLWLHGGGYAMGVPENDYIFLENFILNTNTVVFAPDYVKSLVKPFPGALDDAYLCLKYLKKEADKYLVNPKQIFVGGDSAGGGLTCAVALYARDKKEVDIAAIFPLYPMLDCNNTLSNSNNDGPVWNTYSNKLAWNLYLGTDQRTNISKYASPSLETDFTSFPPLFTYIGTIDPFYDETKEFVNKVLEKQKEVKIKEYPGCFHGFELVAYDKAIGEDARNYILDCYIYATKKFFTE